MPLGSRPSCARCGSTTAGAWWWRSPGAWAATLSTRGERTPCTVACSPPSSRRLFSAASWVLGAPSSTWAQASARWRCRWQRARARGRSASRLRRAATTWASASWTPSRSCAPAPRLPSWFWASSRTTSSSSGRLTLSSATTLAGGGAPSGTSAPPVEWPRTSRSTCPSSSASASCALAPRCLLCRSSTSSRRGSGSSRSAHLRMARRGPMRFSR
mmetsp:Transcript_19542/g.66221  ORF Transcript_19542/g.66221 Transcript_19542/m.66221 type:complete len:215 (-) Transcript_19542:207-851(-)